ncbi:MAG TPA: apolipoprotein N-acyltransferase [Polyangia bacterium]|jgi:apolipoprotein N-acyltransferase
MRPILLALLAAALAVLAAPPFDLWPLALVGLGPLYLAARAVSPWRAAGLGWLAGTAANLAGLSWGVGLLETFVHLGRPSAITVTVAACVYQGLVWALWAGACRLLARRTGLAWLVSGPLVLAVIEATVPFVFPWYFAITAARAWPLAQVAELGGPVAVSALLVLINVIVVDLGAAALQRERAARDLRVAAVVAAAVLVVGLARAGHVAWARGRAPALRVGVVQPNFGIVSQEARKHTGQRYIEGLRAVTGELAGQGAELIVWPESAFPFLFDRQLTREYAPGHPWELRPPHRGRLLAGALTHQFDRPYVFNSAVLFTADRKVAGIYDKNHLLAFGEYIPFADSFPDWAGRMRARLPDSPDIEPGAEPLILVDGALRVAPLICYEDILPAAVHRAARRGPNLLVTLANHAWFGGSGAPRQAAVLAHLRGIETRRDLVRATNTGVSTIGDALGRIRGASDLVEIPRDQPGRPTTLAGEVRLVETFALGPYTAPVFPWACCAGLVLAAVRARRRRPS